MEEAGAVEWVSGSSAEEGVRSARAPWNMVYKATGGEFYSVPLSEKIDIYSLAMTFYTMLALKPPYNGEPGARARILAGIPPSVSLSWDQGFVEILGDMWQRDPKARPSARRVVERLELLQSRSVLEHEQQQQR
ncbi:unnamed protein product [Ectocarpus sp. CCAP 1310/34]|nr:unnamed protein product [Ectocarpus sp. CCAP 1310/34]